MTGFCLPIATLAGLPVDRATGCPDWAEGARRTLPAKPTVVRHSPSQQNL
ncbi:MAG TPA: hypothetical protein V6C84_16830 [Coleofasciculaceae cyanobacterium]